MRLKVGNSVKVKEGVSYPDYDSISISGWQGRIIEIEDGTIGIRWDSITLKQMPFEYIQESEKEGLDWTECFLDIDEVIPTRPRDTEIEAEQMADTMESKFQWAGEDDDEDQRIFSVISGGDDPDQAWHEYLKKMLVFPFEAKVSEPQDRGHFKCGDTVTVHSISDVDDLYGILVDVTLKRKKYVFPLCDLEVLDKKSKNYLPVKDYCVWLANQ